VLERNGEKAVPAKEVALKKIFDAFQNSTDAQRTYREVLYLRQMQSNEHVVKLLNVLKAENDRDLYLVFEYLETDLHAAICANILEEVHKQYIIHQAFKALTYMHSAGLVHRDMKPANLLLNADCVMKVADFGLARTVSETGEIVGGDLEGKPSGSVLTDYIATRWYRAPEVLVGSTSYGKAVDLWSLGCILGTRTHLPRLRPADSADPAASVSVPPLPSPSRHFHLLLRRHRRMPSLPLSCARCVRGQSSAVSIARAGVCTSRRSV
jgi:serine/threonine protein kinase